MNSKTKQQKPALDSVDQIRNILFGEQIAVIERRFEKLEKNLTSAISDLSKKLDKTNQSLSNKIDDSNKKLNSDTTSLAQEQTSALNKLEKTINTKIVETESDLLNQIQAGLQKLDDKASHRNELAKLLKDMANKLAD